jgi:hypothetical protein
MSCKIGHYGEILFYLSQVFTPMYTWLILVFGEAQGKALPSLVEQAFDTRRRVRAAAARGETQHGHTWLF